MGHTLEAGLVVVRHAGLHVGVEQVLHLGLELVGRDTCSDLHEEDDPEEDGEGEGHAVVLLDGSAAPEEGHKEDDAADDDEEDRRGEELVAQEVEVLAVGSLDHSASHYEEQPGQLKHQTLHPTLKGREEGPHCKEEVEEEERVLDTLDAGLHGGAGLSLLTGRQAGWSYPTALEWPAHCTGVTDQSPSPTYRPLPTSSNTAL